LPEQSACQFSEGGGRRGEGGKWDCPLQGAVGITLRVMQGPLAEREEYELRRTPRAPLFQRDTEFSKSKAVAASMVGMVQSIVGSALRGVPGAAERARARCLQNSAARPNPRQPTL
jgi:hypothetical protein